MIYQNRSGEEVSFVVKNESEHNNGTFIVKIINQQNSTWQGTVTWVEEQRTRNFRSALELLKLIDGALEESNEVSGDNHQK